MKGFASKYPFKQEPRNNKTILFEGTKEELEAKADPLVPLDSIVKVYQYKPSDKFIIIYKEKSHAKENA